jgi:hypothetical protein
MKHVRSQTGTAQPTLEKSTYLRCISPLRSSLRPLRRPSALCVFYGGFQHINLLLQTRYLLIEPLYILAKL